MIGEAARRTDELRGQLNNLVFGGTQFGVVIQAMVNDAFEATNVDQIERQRPAACTIDTHRTVLLGQADQFLGLAQLGPREGAGEQLPGETSDVLSARLRLFDQALWITHGVGPFLLRVVLVVGVAAPGGLLGTRLDQRSSAVDAHQGAIAPDVNLLTEIAGWDRIECLLELNVVIGMNLALSPNGRVEAFSDQGHQCRLLHRFEDRQRPFARRSVPARAGHLETPADRFALDVISIAPVFTGKEIVACIWNGAFHGRLRGWRGGWGRIDHEAAMPGVLLKCALEDGIVAIGASDRCTQIINDCAGRNPTEELPGILDAINEVVQLLRECGVNILMATVNEGDDQRPKSASAINSRVVDQSQSPEVDFHYFARRNLGHAHS